MEKVSIVIMVIIITLTLKLDQSNANGADELLKWAQSVHGQKEKVTHLKFYFQDIMSGKNPTALPVAQSKITVASPTFFGKIFMMDDPLTVGPNLNSKLVGRSQGLYGSAGQKDVSLIMVTSFVFKEGKYNGSSLSVLSHNPALHPTRELAIVGGTGYFRLARGVASLKTISLNMTSGDATVEYNVVVFHY